jgi:tetratricopeptide (TPR) repeat protein
MKTRPRKTLLQCLMTKRHLTREQAIEVLDRRARDMGVRDFALSLRQLDRWLAGDVATLPRPTLCRVVEAEFGYPVQQLLAISGGLVEASSTRQAGPMPQGSHEDVGLAPTTVHLEHVRRGLHEVLAGGALQEASLEDWELTVTRYGAATRDRAASTILSDLLADVGELRRTFAQCRSISGMRRLTRVAAHIAGLMCLTLIKLDERGAFRGWAATARVAALEAEDPQTYSWVLAQEAYGHFYSDDFPEAVRVARHAQTVAPKTPCVGSVLAAALEARALGVLGRADETHAALREAEAILMGLDDATVAASAFGYDEAQLRFHEGNALTHLGDTKAAWRAQERALALVPAADFMDRALTRLDRAVCLARDGDASAAASEALDTLMGLSPEQRRGIISRRAEQLVARLPERRRAPSTARELRDLLMLPASTEC